MSNLGTISNSNVSGLYSLVAAMKSAPQAPNVGDSN
jgi:hypothetical protein